MSRDLPQQSAASLFARLLDRLNDHKLRSKQREARRVEAESYAALRQDHEKRLAQQGIHEVTDSPGEIGLNNSAERENWVAKTLANIPRGLRILDAGAGECQYKKYCGHLDYVSQDFAQYDGAGDKKGLQMGSWNTHEINIVSDISNIPLPDRSIDVVMCTEVLEHLPDATIALREFSRLTKKGGKLIITAPFCSLTHFAPYHFSTGFSKYWYEHHLREQGYKILEMTPNGNYFQYLAQELHRVESVSANQSEGVRMTPLERQSMDVLFSLLKRMNRADKDSNELLCFGWHVLAEKEI